MLEIGETVTLNNKDYVVINTVLLHNIKYVFLSTLKMPLEIMVATEKIQDDELVLDEIKDNSELDYVLSQLVLSKDN